MYNCGLRKISPQHTLTEISKAVDSGFMFLAPWKVDASAAILLYAKVYAPLV